MEAEAYADFLTDLQETIAQPKKEEGVAEAEMGIAGLSVAAVWHSDADVIKAHFAKREERREAAGERKKRVKPEESEQACLSRWARWAQLQGRTRRRSRSLEDVVTAVVAANKLAAPPPPPPPPVVVPPLPHRQGLHARPQSARRAADAAAALSPALKGSSGRAVAEARRQRAAGLGARGGAEQSLLDGASLLTVSPTPTADLVAPWVMWEKNARYSCHAVGRNAVQQVAPTGFGQHMGGGPPPQYHPSSFPRGLKTTDLAWTKPKPTARPTTPRSTAGSTPRRAPRPQSARLPESTRL